MHHTMMRLILPSALALFLCAGLWAGDLAGAWKFVVDTGEGTREFDVTMEENGSSVIATIGEDKVKGAFAEGVLELAGDVYSPPEGYRAPFKLKGKLAAGELTGDIRWDTYDVTFKASKVQ